MALLANQAAWLMLACLTGTLRATSAVDAHLLLYSTCEENELGTTVESPSPINYKAGRDKSACGLSINSTPELFQCTGSFHVAHPSSLSCFFVVVARVFAGVGPHCLSGEIGRRMDTNDCVNLYCIYFCFVFCFVSFSIWWGIGGVGGGFSQAHPLR